MSNINEATFHRNVDSVNRAQDAYKKKIASATSTMKFDFSKDGDAERAQKELDALNKLYRSGVISFAKYQSALQKLKSEIDKNVAESCYGTIECLNAFIDDYMEASLMQTQIASDADNVLNNLLVNKKQIEHQYYVECFLTESEAVDAYMEAEEGALQKIKKSIDKLINTIKEFFSNIKKKQIDKTDTADISKKIHAAEKQFTPEQLNEKVKVIRNEKSIKILNDYIVAMVKLEREIMNLNFLNATDTKALGNGRYVTEYEAIMKKVDALNKAYDDKIIKENQDIIEMARKDAIRFSDKQMKNIKVDFEAIEKGSNKVLAQFKKDADGCEEIIKVRGIHKLSNFIAARVRKMTYDTVDWKMNNFGRIFQGVLVTAIIMGGGVMVKTPAGQQKLAEIRNNVIRAAQVAEEPEGCQDKKSEDKTTNDNKKDSDKKEETPNAENKGEKESEKKADEKK